MWYFLLKMKVFFLKKLLSCSSNDDSDSGNNNGNLVGATGNPRFNLQFTNENNVDLDLYVRTPSGAVIYYGNPTADGGTLDVDCYCSSCPQGPNENIFWQNGTAPSGTYEYWVDYFGSCGGGNASSDYIIRVLRNNTVL